MVWRGSARGRRGDVLESRRCVDSHSVWSLPPPQPEVREEFVGDPPCVLAVLFVERPDAVRRDVIQRPISRGFEHVPVLIPREEGGIETSDPESPQPGTGKPLDVRGMLTLTPQ